MKASKYWIFISFLSFFLISSSLSAVSLDTVYHKEELVSVNGVKLFVKIIGKGEPLVIIHGGPGLSYDYFIPHLDPLAKKYQLIFYDQRGTGRSSPEVDSSTMTLDNFVEDLEGLRKHLKLEQVNLVGHSWGGFIESLYAIKYPRKVRSIVYMASAPLSSHLRDVMIEKQKTLVTQEDMKNQRTIARSKEFLSGDSLAIRRMFRAIYKPSIFAQKQVYKLNFHFNRNYKKSQWLLAYLYPSMVKYDYYNELKVVKAPALIIQGEYDPTPIESAQELNRQLKNSELFVLPQCGHFPFLEKPDEVFNKMDSFYSSLHSK